MTEGDVIRIKGLRRRFVVRTVRDGSVDAYELVGLRAGALYTFSRDLCTVDEAATRERKEGPGVVTAEAFLSLGTSVVVGVVYYLLGRSHGRRVAERRAEKDRVVFAMPCPRCGHPVSFTATHLEDVPFTWQCVCGATALVEREERRS